MSNSKRCAACKYLRRRCPEYCVLAPLFPPTYPQRFACVHKIFGAGNITKMLQQLPVNLRATAADCMVYEASSRIRDPVYGCVGIVSQLQQEILDAETELNKTNGEIALHKAQTQLLEHQQWRMDQEGQPSLPNFIQSENTTFALH